MIRNDGTEVSLEKLQELYGKAAVAAQALETIQQLYLRQQQV